jgi:hypothetical protein
MVLLSQPPIRDTGSRIILSGLLLKTIRTVSNLSRVFKQVIRSSAMLHLAAALCLGTVTGCASLAKPAQEITTRAIDRNMDRLTAELELFYNDLGLLLGAIETLYQRPGWPDMEAILVISIAIPDRLDQEWAETQVEEKLEDWTDTWGESGQALYLTYLAIADRCSALEMRRIGLLGQLAALQASYLQGTFAALSHEGEARARSLFDTVEALSRIEEELNSYSLNDLGLYDPILAGNTVLDSTTVQQKETACNSRRWDLVAPTQTDFRDKKLLPGSIPAHSWNIRRHNLSFLSIASADSPRDL